MSPRTVLVVDDDPSILHLVDQVLADAGYAVLLASDGAQALGILSGAPSEAAPGLVLLDMRMPVMDGWAFAAELRSRQLDIPIVVMTAATNARKWAMEVGAAGYIEKPFDLDDLVAAAERAFRAPPLAAEPPAAFQSAAPRLFGRAFRRLAWR